MKKCVTCKVEKIEIYFNKNSRAKDGLQPACRDCNALYRSANREKALAYYAKNRHAWAHYHETDRIRNREQRRARNLAYSRSNPEVFKAYREANKDAFTARANKRRALKLLATPKWAEHEAMAEFYFAAQLLGMVTGEWYSVDHIVPLIGPKAKSGPFTGRRLVCGLHCKANLQVLTEQENASKANRWWPDMP